MRSKWLSLLFLTSILGASLEAKEIILQNGLDGYEGASDATLNGQVESTRVLNYGHADTLKVAGVPNGGMRQLGLIQFGDLVKAGGIPKGAVIQSARLELYKVKDAGNEETFAKLQPSQRFLHAYLVRQPWKAGTSDGAADDEGVTFSHRNPQGEIPSFWGQANQIEAGPVADVDYDATKPATSPLEQGSEGQWVSWDVTRFVQQWLENPETNHGVLLLARGYYTGAYFASCESGDAQLRPRLVISY